MSLDFFDCSGRPYAYSDDGETIYTFDGEPIAYIDGDSIFGFSGDHLGFFEDHQVWDHSGSVVLFAKRASGGPTKPLTPPPPLKCLKELKPLKGLKGIRPSKSRRGTSWSARTPESIFED
jgi:hypothetical protein